MAIILKNVKIRPNDQRLIEVGYWKKDQRLIEVGYWKKFIELQFIQEKTADKCL